MDSTTFSRELSKYKIVRLADHTRIRLKTIRKPDSKPKLLNNSNANNATNKPLSLGVDNEAEDFWNMMERVNANTLSPGDMKKLIAAMKEEHPSMVGALNLHDLDYLASLLQK